MQAGHEPLPHLDFEEIEQQQNIANLDSMEVEIANRSDALGDRILRYSAQVDVPVQSFWNALDADPRGPLAAVLATEARRQNLHEDAAAEFIDMLDHVEEFRRLPRRGKGVHYIAEDGQIILRSQLGHREPRPSEAIDFTWETGNLTCFAAQKYTREGGGNQDSRFDETVRLLRNFQQHQDEGVALCVLVDGLYYTDDRMGQLQEWIREENPRSYVLSINELQQVLNQLMNAE